jgi:hypothetical protein
LLNSIEQNENLSQDDKDYQINQIYRNIDMGFRDENVLNFYKQMQSSFPLVLAEYQKIKDELDAALLNFAFRPVVYDEIEFFT